MTISTAPALLLGIGGRVLLDVATRTEESFRDYMLVGCWQGVGLWYAFNNDLAAPVALGIALKLFIEYSLAQDATKSAITVFSLVLGIIATDFLSGIFDKPKERRSSSSSKKTSSSSRPRKETNPTRPSNPSRPSRKAVSDITSVDSNSDLLGPRASMTPMEREIAALRARASLADSERRRFKEERKWAVAQGNHALAEECKWQVKRYSALMKSFHREADDKIRGQASHRLATIEENPGSSRQRGEHTTVSVNISPSQLKSAVRVNVR
ncbi:hypothetical protein C8J56DRAFT_432854 [Mycena floridula]|nr:hypothetical protein C8J56DRAFT_432854 [Mycena floridula]